MKFYSMYYEIVTFVINNCDRKVKKKIEISKKLDNETA